MAHKSGFVNIVGSPNVGKSTLMNQLVGEKLSIVSSKAQTTRHRILGIVNEEDYQIVFSDTPGVVNAAYKLHENMMEYVNASISDADVLIFMTDTHENEMNHKETLERIQRLKVPVLCLINKIDTSDHTKVMERVGYWQEKLPNAKVYAVSALHKFNIEAVWEEILFSFDSVHLENGLPLKECNLKSNHSKQTSLGNHYLGDSPCLKCHYGRFFKVH
jgi:GTP-binding protein Era